MTDTHWLIFGFTGQFFFGCRFLVQWIASERAGKSVVPVSFWYLSIVGSAMILFYAIHRVDPVIILGQSTGFLIYTRNLVLLGNDRHGKSPKPLGA